MKNASKKNLLLTCIIASIAPISAWATLGQDVQSVTGDAQNLNSTSSSQTLQNVKINKTSKVAISTAQTTNYDTYSFTTPSNVEITEFIANDQVFAVTWNGPVKTNIKQLLGQYFGNINKSPITSSVHQASISDAQIQYSSGGYPGAFYGSAVLKSQLPQGFSFKDAK